MKIFLLWISLLLVSFIFLQYVDEYNRAERHLLRLKYVAEEAAAAAAQYQDNLQYSNGRKVFNQVEGIKAAEYVIKESLNLDNNFVPQAGSYWRDKITYRIEFFDDSNTAYPMLYSHPSSRFTLAIGDPTVIVTINAGRPRFSIAPEPSNLFRTAAHEWLQR
jgi:hypothetical protein